MNRDKVIFSGLTFYGYHGVHEEERTLGQRFTLDLEIGLDLSKAAVTDDINDTVSYSDAYKIAGATVEGPPCNLIETVAEQIARALFAQTAAEWILVRLSKPSAPIKGYTTGSVAVEILRQRPA